MVKEKDYQNYLVEQIPYLNTKYHLCGGEGIAYFIDENFVIKKYVDDINNPEFEEQFELFCKEWQNFAEKGYNLPKLYAFIKVINFNYYSGKEKNKYNYYVLQERVKGKELFYGDLLDAFPVLENNLTFDKYKKLLDNPEINLTAFEQIVKSYLNYTIENNINIANIKSDELENFIGQTYKIYMSAKYLKPDLYPSNILINKDKLTLIDPEILLESTKFKGKSERVLQDMFLCEMLNIFQYNYYISSGTYGLQNLTRGYFNIDNEIAQNKEACEQAIRKVASAVSRVCDIHKFANYNFYRRIAETFDDILGEEKGHFVLSECGIGLEF